jgi:hypothetical protein
VPLNSPVADFFIIRVSEYVGADKVQQEVVAPPVAAMYAWLFDFRQLLGRPATDVGQALARFLNHQGRLITPRSDPFLRASWRAARPPFKMDRRDVVIDHLARNTVYGQQLATMGVVLQRPAYCGISSDLHSRLNQHLEKRSSHLLDDLHPIRATDCAVLWMPLDETTDGPEDATIDAQMQGVASYAPADEAAVEASDPESLALRILESFVIRSAAPTLNELMDS